MVWQCREFFFSNIFNFLNFLVDQILFELYFLGHFSILRHRILAPLPPPPTPGSLLGGQQGGCAPNTTRPEVNRNRCEHLDSKILEASRLPPTPILLFFPVFKDFFEFFNQKIDFSTNRFRCQTIEFFITFRFFDHEKLIFYH